MRWCSFATPSGGPPRLGAVSAAEDSSKVLDVAGWARSRDVETPADLVDLIESSAAVQERVTDLVRSAPADGVGWMRPDDVILLAPLRTASSIRHVVARDGVVPVFLHSGRHTVLGPEEDLAWPAYTAKLDFSCQVAAVVGKPGRDLTPTEAVQAVFGYTVMIQWSARDVGREVATTLGPWLVTPDEWEPRAGHLVTVEVDGEQWSTGTTDCRPWTFGQALSWVSQGEALWPADVLGLGPTAGGTGRDLDRWLQKGQRLQVTVEGLGSLGNRLSTGAPASP